MTVTEAVQALEQQGGATVNDVADQLGIDQSGASRFITRAVNRGYLRKVAGPATLAIDSSSSPTRAPPW